MVTANMAHLPTAASTPMTPNFSRPLATITKPCPKHRLCHCPSPPTRSRSQILRPAASTAEEFRRAVSAVSGNRTESQDSIHSTEEGPGSIALSPLSPVQNHASGSDTTSRTPDTPSSPQSTESTYQSPPSSADSSPVDRPNMTSLQSPLDQPPTNIPVIDSSAGSWTNQTQPANPTSIPPPAPSSVYSMAPGGLMHSRLAWIMAGMTVLSTVFQIGSFVLQANGNGNSGLSRRDFIANSTRQGTFILILLFSVICLAFFCTVWLLPQARARSNSSTTTAIREAAANLVKQAPPVPKPGDAPLMHYYLSLIFNKQTKGKKIHKTPDQYDQYNLKLQKIDMNWFSFFCWLVKGEPRSRDYQGYIMDRDRAEQLERINSEQEEWQNPEFVYDDDDSSYHVGLKKKDLRMHEEFSILGSGQQSLGDGIRRRNSYYALDEGEMGGSPFGFKDKRMMEVCH